MKWVQISEADTPSLAPDIWWNKRAPYTDGAATRLVADPAYQDDEATD